MRQPTALPTLTALLLERGSAPYSAFSSLAGACVMACVFLFAEAAAGVPTGSDANAPAVVSDGSGGTPGAGAAATAPQRPSPGHQPIATKLPGGRRRRGAIYARYSSRFQHLIDDQVQTCRAWAAANDVGVPDELVFTDAKTSGKKNRRAGFQAMMAAFADGSVDVVVIFNTSRLFRKPPDQPRPHTVYAGAAGN